MKKIEGFEIAFYVDAVGKRFLTFKFRRKDLGRRRGLFWGPLMRCKMGQDIDQRSVYDEDQYAHCCACVELTCRQVLTIEGEGAEWVWPEHLLGAGGHK